MKRIIFLQLIMTTLCFTQAFGQFEISAELRPRLEVNNGFNFTPTQETDVTTYISQRSRLNFQLTKEKYAIYVSLQDARIWGDENISSGTGAFSNSSSTGLYQAWMKLKLFKSSTLKIGRQEFMYDDQRLLSIRNWPQSGITYDAILFQYYKNKWQFDIALSYNNDNKKGTPAGSGLNNFDVDPISRRLRTLNFVYLKRNILDGWYVSTTGLLTGYQKDKTTSTIYLMATYGLHSEFKKAGFESRINLYGQSGKSQLGKDVSSWMITAEAAYRLKKWRLGAGIDLLSGHDASNNDSDYQKTEHNFDLFYGIRYLRYGLMNQYVLPSGTLNGGLVDIYPSIHFYPNTKNKISIDYHHFALQQSVADPFAEKSYLEGSLGSEIDLVWSHSFSKELILNAGFCYYITNDTYSKVKQVDPQDLESPYFGWLMITFKPTLFRFE